MEQLCGHRTVRDLAREMLTLRDPHVQHWRSNGDFAGVRGNDALARIPAEERKEWERLWAEVDALLRRASEPD